MSYNGTMRELTLYSRYRKFFEVAIMGLSLFVGAGFSGSLITSIDDLQSPLWIVVGGVAIFFMLIAFVFGVFMIFALRAIDRGIQKMAGQ